MAVSNALNPDFSSGVGFGSGARIIAGAGAPGALVAAKGTVYINTTATTTTTRIYINTDGAATWATVTTSA